MKSLDTLPLARRLSTWFEEEEPTSEIWVLGSLINGEVTTLELRAPLAEAAELFLEYRIPAIAILDGSTLCGLITRTDVIRVIVKQPAATVADAMSGFVLAMPAESSIEAAAALMACEQVGQVVVTNNRGDLAGVVSALDIARHVARRAGYLAA